MPDPSPAPSQPTSSVNSGTPPATGGAQPQGAPVQHSWLFGNGPVVVYIVVLFAAMMGASLWLARSAQRGWGKLRADATAWNKLNRQFSQLGAEQAFDPAQQAEAEQLLQRTSAGDSAAADQILAESDGWTGKTQRTQRASQLISAALNRDDLHSREAAIQAELAFDGVPRNAVGLATLEQQAADPSRRVWALWTLGALGNRGVDPVHAAKTIDAYLDDPNVTTRASAVDGLAILGTDETVPMLLDRFRNDPSPVVQERAACGLAQAGFYTHEQRMVAAQSLVGWLSDASLSQQQRAWILQALGDISGQHFGPDPAAWQRWLASTR